MAKEFKKLQVYEVLTVMIARKYDVWKTREEVTEEMTGL